MLSLICLISIIANKGKTRNHFQITLLSIWKVMYVKGIWLRLFKLRSQRETMHWNYIQKKIIWIHFTALRAHQVALCFEFVQTLLLEFICNIHCNQFIIHTMHTVIGIRILCVNSTQPVAFRDHINVRSWNA